jgi:tRNA-splicing ligase RtcB
MIEQRGAVRLILPDGPGFEAAPAAVSQLQALAACPYINHDVTSVVGLPDLHPAPNCTVGTVAVVTEAVVPAAIGDDIGCGMLAVPLPPELTLSTLFQALAAAKASLATLRQVMEAAIPSGRSHFGADGDTGSWHGHAGAASTAGVLDVPPHIHSMWSEQAHGQPSLAEGWQRVVAQAAAVTKSKQAAQFGRRFPGGRGPLSHLGTLGSGNHFVELAAQLSPSFFPAAASDAPATAVPSVTDPALADSPLWLLVHSGSRGAGSRVGAFFAALADGLCRKYHSSLPNAAAPDEVSAPHPLAFLPHGTPEYSAFLAGHAYCIRFARANRALIAQSAISALDALIGAQLDAPLRQQLRASALAPASAAAENGPFDCCHNFFSQLPSSKAGDKRPRTRQSQSLGVLTFPPRSLLLRKGAAVLLPGERALIPGAMGGLSFVVRGTRSAQGGGGPLAEAALWSCSHGAGRLLSRGAAARSLTVDNLAAVTSHQGVECLSDRSVLDESPEAYKDVRAVVRCQAQAGTLVPEVAMRAILCIKGTERDKAAHK